MKGNKQKNTNLEINNTNPSPNFFNKNLSKILIGVLFIILSTIFFKVGYLGYFPTSASDTIQWTSAIGAMDEYEKEHNERALWNPNVFSGMPGYLINYHKAVYFIDDIRKIFDNFIHWRLLLLFIGGLGVFWFCRMQNMSPFAALFAALGFSLSCHFIGLVEIGHNTKFRSLMYMPWVIAGAVYLKNTKSLLAFGITSAALIAQLRESHPQIAYYTVLMIGIYWFVNLYYAVKSKKYKNFSKFTILLVLAGLIALIAVADPFLPMNDYSKLSIRGGEKGLSYDYATGWSFHPFEIFSFINPDALGGAGSTYWGWMQFTQTHMYMGIVLLLFAFFPIAFFKKYSKHNKKVIVFAYIASALGILFSFGRFFPGLTKLMLDYFPFWNKFRVPATLLIIPQFCFTVLAGYGFNSVLTVKISAKFKKAIKVLVIAFICLLVLFAILKTTFASSFSFMHMREIAQFNPSFDENLMPQNNPMVAKQLMQYRMPRINAFYNGWLIAFGFIIATFGLVFMFINKKINKYVFAGLIIVIAIFDLTRIDLRHTKSYSKPKVLDNYYAKTEFEKIMEKDDSLFRVYAIDAFGSNRLSMYNQSIGGYHGAKLKNYQELIENCFNQPVKSNAYNKNITDMLGVKYITLASKYSLPNLTKLASSNNRTLWQVSPSVKRAWFVNSAENFNTKKDVFDKINSENFNPFEKALVYDKKIAKNYSKTNSNLDIVSWNSHNINIKANTDAEQFMVLSEVYYPKGWNAYINGNKTEIYQVNHILRGIVVPKGENDIKFKFEPESVKNAKLLSIIGIAISSLALILGMIIKIRNKNEL